MNSSFLTALLFFPLLKAYSGRIFSLKQYASPNIDNIDWCAYWGKLGINRKECMHLLQMTTRIPSTTSAAGSQASTPLCVNKFRKSSCVPDQSCASGLLCTEMHAAQCCHPPRGVCPTPAQIGFTCMVNKPTNWCEIDADCGNKDQKCCPTGCKYNICI